MPNPANDHVVLAGTCGAEGVVLSDPSSNPFSAGAAPLNDHHGGP